MAAACGRVRAEDRTPACACKGIRSCLLCEDLKGKGPKDVQQPKGVHRFQYDPEESLAMCRDGKASSFPFPGVFLWENFISEEEEVELVRQMDQNQWHLSQSGRRKQDFGPKVNFKKRKVQMGNFKGLPAVSQKLVVRMHQKEALSDFSPVEQCNLDYSPERGSAIDPHLDDTWLWGERLVTINLLSDTTLSMSLEQDLAQEVQVAVALPRRSLVVLYGQARHTWKHAINRRDIHARRVCSTFRELSADFLPGGQYAELGAQLLCTALSFTGTPV